MAGTLRKTVVIEENILVYEEPPKMWNMIRMLTNYNNACAACSKSKGTKIDLTNINDLEKIYRPLLVLVRRVLNLLQKGYWNAANYKLEKDNILEALSHDSSKNFDSQIVSRRMGEVREICDRHLTKISESITEKAMPFEKCCELYKAYREEIWKHMENVHKIVIEEKLKIPMADVVKDDIGIVYKQCVLKEGKKVGDGDENMLIFTLKKDAVELKKPNYLSLDTYPEEELKFLKRMIKEGNLGEHLLREYMMMMNLILLYRRFNGEDTEKFKMHFESSFIIPLTAHSKVAASIFLKIFESITNKCDNRECPKDIFEFLKDQINKAMFYINFEENCEVNVQIKANEHEQIKVDAVLKLNEESSLLKFTAKSPKMSLEIAKIPDNLSKLFDSLLQEDKAVLFQKLIHSRFYQGLRYGVAFLDFASQLKLLLLLHLLKMAKNPSKFSKLYEEVKSMLNLLTQQWYEDYKGLFVTPEFKMVLKKALTVFENDIDGACYVNNDWKEITWKLLAAIDFVTCQKFNTSCLEHLLNSGNYITFKHEESSRRINGALRLGDKRKNFYLEWDRCGKLSLHDLTEKEVRDLLANENLLLGDRLRLLFLLRAVGNQFWDDHIGQWDEGLNKKLSPTEKQIEFINYLKKKLRPPDEELIPFPENRAVRILKLCNFDSRYPNKCEGEGETEQQETGVTQTQEEEGGGEEEEQEEEGEENQDDDNQEGENQEGENQDENPNTEDEDFDHDETSIEPIIKNIKLQGMQFDMADLESIKFQIFYTNCSSMQIEAIRSEDEVNEWKVMEIDKMPSEELCKATLDSLKNQISKYFSSNIDTMKEVQIYHALICYMVVAYCAEQSVLEAKAILKDLPNELKVKYPNLYSKATSLKFETRTDFPLLSVREALITLRMQMRAESFRLEKKFMAITDSDRYSCQMELQHDDHLICQPTKIKIGTKSSQYEENSLFSTAEALARANDFYLRYASKAQLLNKDFEKKVAVIVNGIIFLYGLLLCIRHLLNIDEEDKISDFMILLLTENLGYSQKTAEGIVGVLLKEFDDWQQDYQTLVNNARTTLELELPKLVRPLELTKETLYFTGNPSVPLFLYKDEEKTKKVTSNDEMEDLIKTELEALDSGDDVERVLERLLKLITAFYVYLTSNNLATEAYIDLLKRLLSEQCDPNFKKYRDLLIKQVEKISECNRISWPEDAEESVKKGLADLKKEKPAEIETPTLLKLYGKCEQVIVVLDDNGNVFYHTASEKPRFIELNGELENYETTELGEFTIKGKLKRLYGNFKSLFKEDYLTAETIVLMERAFHDRSNKVTQEYPKSFEEVWVKIKEKVGDELDEMKQYLANLYDTKYGRLRKDIDAGRNHADKIVADLQAEKPKKINQESISPVKIVRSNSNKAIRTEVKRRGVTSLQIDECQIYEVSRDGIPWLLVYICVVKEKSGQALAVIEGKKKIKFGRIIEILMMLLEALKERLISQDTYTATFCLLIGLCAFIIIKTREIENALELFAEYKQDILAQIQIILKIKKMTRVFSVVALFEFFARKIIQLFDDHGALEISNIMQRLEGISKDFEEKMKQLKKAPTASLEDN